MYLSPLNIRSFRLTNGCDSVIIVLNNTINYIKG